MKSCPGSSATAGSPSAGTSADPDITAMALQALAKYTDRADVAEAVEEALSCLSALQNNVGGYASWGTTNSESVAQVIVALGELGISLDDSRFVKNGNTLVDNPAQLCSGRRRIPSHAGWHCQPDGDGAGVLCAGLGAAQ